MFKKIIVSIGSSLALILPTTLATTGVIFKDVPPNEWYSAAVTSLYDKKIMRGYEDENFNPARAVTRAELAQTLDTTLRYIENPEGTKAWDQYKNKDFSYTIAHPSAWKPIAFHNYLTGFQPKHMEGTAVQWAVIVTDDSGAPDALDIEINKMGANYGKMRTLMRDDININGLTAAHVTARTIQNPRWVHEQVFIQQYGKIYIITNGGIPHPEFELFYQSFKLLPLKT